MPNKPENHEEHLEDKLPDRPLECSECKKNIAIYYTELVGGTSVHTCMCSDCPVLQHKLFGLSHEELERSQHGGHAGLACGNCGTTMESLRVGHPVGCSNCYEVFEELLISELHAMGKIPLRLVNAKKSQPFYMGRSPGETEEISPSMRLLALNEALNETVKREDYEQAAWLRDQINALTKEQENKNERQ